ncbi:MAG: TRAP transporter large permease subunit [Pseudomonadota bacterium]
MFAGLVVFLLLGYPVAFALAANGLLFGLVGIGLGHFGFDQLQALPDRVFGIMSNATLLAVPFFTFMGLILERSGMAEDLLDCLGQLFGALRGGLAYSVILVGALLAATTGVVAASVIAMGLISLPMMLRLGYDKRLAAGVIAASGTLAQIIPPSLVLIILADQLGVGVGDMYRGAMTPALVLTGLYLLFVFVVALVHPAAAPAMPAQARTLRGAALAGRVLTAMVPPLLLVFLVLGTIFLGIATPTEGGAMGAAGALLLALAKGRLNRSLLSQATDATARLTSFVIFILIGSTVFSLVFRLLDGDLWVEGLLAALPGGELGFLIAVNLLVFVLAFFLDFFEIAFIIVPLLAPVAQKLGIDLVWFGVLLGINMQTSFMHPPFGFALFYLRSVAPRSVRTRDIYWGAIPFVLIQLLMVALVLTFPGLVSSPLDSAGTESMEIQTDPGEAGYLLPPGDSTK